MLFLSLVISFIIFSFVSGFNFNKFHIPFRQSRFQSLPEWVMNADNDEEPLEVRKITVKFVNTPSGKDVVAENIDEGTNLLFVADSNGIKLPRACRLGLCGSCSCEVVDPQAVKTDTNPRDGYATIRACSSKCFVPQGMQEMIIDLSKTRVIKRKQQIPGTTPDPSIKEEDDDPVSYLLILPYIIRFDFYWYYFLD